MAKNNINKTIIEGNLTADPKAIMSKTKPGEVVGASFSIAVNYSYKRKLNEKETVVVEGVDYFTIKAWNGLGNNLLSFKTKGDSVIVTGRNKQDRWTDGNGNECFGSHIEADEIQYR